MVDTCHVTGSVVLPDGSSASVVTLTFQRSPWLVAPTEGASVLPSNVTVDTDSSGALSVNLVPGSYKVRAQADPDVVYPAFTIIVPDETATNLEDIILPLPPKLDDAAQAIVDARAALEEAQTARSELAEALPTILETLEKANEAIPAAEAAIAAARISYGVFIHNEEGVAEGTYYAEMSTPFPSLATRAFCEIIGGDPGSSVTLLLEVAGVGVYGPVVVEHGTPVEANNLDINIPAGASVFWSLTDVSGSVTEVFARCYGKFVQ